MKKEFVFGVWCLATIMTGGCGKQNVPLVETGEDTNVVNALQVLAADLPATPNLALQPLAAQERTTQTNNGGLATNTGVLLPKFFMLKNRGGYLSADGQRYCELTSAAHWQIWRGPLPITSAPVINQNDLGSLNKFIGECRLPQGFFKLPSGAGYLVREEGKFCGILSQSIWNDLGGPADNIPVIPSIPNTMVGTGACFLPQGFFFSKGVGYFTNADGAYCALETYSHWLFNGGPVVTPAIRTVDQIPSNMSNRGICDLKAGLFSVNGIGYRSRGDRTYCRYDSRLQWLATGGPADLNEVSITKIPSSLRSIGVCK